MNFKTILLYSGLFSGLGIFSFFLLVNYTGLPDRIAEALYSTGACLFFIAIFNVLGYFTLRVSSWLNIQYALNVKSRTKIIFIYALVTELRSTGHGQITDRYHPSLHFPQWGITDPDCSLAGGTGYPGVVIG